MAYASVSVLVHEGDEKLFVLVGVLCLFSFFWKIRGRADSRPPGRTKGNVSLFRLFATSAPPPLDQVCFRRGFSGYRFHPSSGGVISF